MAVRFVLGGARSGKSRYAQDRAEGAAARSGGRPLMIATAQAFDAEMTERIGRHKAERGPGWDLVEAPFELAAAICALPAGQATVVDCLTLWLSNLMLAERDLEAAMTDLCAALAATPAEVWVVANEVGLSIVPENALARRFRDDAGRLNRQVAALAEEAVVLFAGLPLILKSPQP